MADEKVVSIATPGWDGVEAEPPTQPEYAATEQAQIDKAIARMFATKEGEEVMDFLTDAYLHQPCWAPGFTTDYGFFREGQNTLIRELQARIKRAKES
tara:strand:+ start:576 stop:869 length:294 start_codon:yes stop_codon:yes gene_type:complete